MCVSVSECVCVFCLSIYSLSSVSFSVTQSDYFDHSSPFVISPLVSELRLFLLLTVDSFFPLVVVVVVTSTTDAAAGGGGGGDDALNVPVPI